MTMAADPALEDVVEAPAEGTATTPEPLDDEVDPAAELAARFDNIEAELARLRGIDPNAVRSALGRIPGLQSQVDDFAKRDPVAAIDPRVSASESALVALAETLLDDPDISDARKASLRSAVSGVEQARSQRELDRREAALEARVRAAIVPPAPQPAESGETAWVKATAVVTARAERLGLSPEDALKAIPWADIRRDSGEDAEAAIALAIEWLYEHREDAPAARVSERRAAMAPSPARAGAPANDMERYLAYGAGTLNLPEKELRELETRLKGRGEI